MNEREDAFELGEGMSGRPCYEEVAVDGSIHASLPIGASRLPAQHTTHWQTSWLRQDRWRTWGVSHQSAAHYGTSTAREHDAALQAPAPLSRTPY